MLVWTRGTYPTCIPRLSAAVLTSDSPLLPSSGAQGTEGARGEGESPGVVDGARGRRTKALEARVGYGEMLVWARSRNPAYIPRLGGVMLTSDSPPLPSSGARGTEGGGRRAEALEARVRC
jgi:hypothetical protein